MRHMFLGIAILLLATAFTLVAADGRSTYVVGKLQQNGIYVPLPGQRLTLFSNRQYSWATPARGPLWRADPNVISGQFTYNVKTRQFRLGGQLSAWGPGRLNDDTSISFDRGDASIVRILRRVPQMTICPIWPLCS